MSLKTRLRGIFNRGRMGDSAPSTRDTVIPKSIVEQAKREGWKMSPAKQAAEWTQDIDWHNRLLRQQEKATKFRMWCELWYPDDYFWQRRTGGAMVERQGVWQSLPVPTRLVTFRMFDPLMAEFVDVPSEVVDRYIAHFMAKGDHVDALWWRGARTVEASRTRPIEPLQERLTAAEQEDARIASALRAKVDMIERSRSGRIGHAEST